MKIFFRNLMAILVSLFSTIMILIQWIPGFIITWIKRGIKYTFKKYRDASLILVEYYIWLFRTLILCQDPKITAKYFNEKINLYTEHESFNTFMEYYEDTF